MADTVASSSVCVPSSFPARLDLAPSPTKSDLGLTPSLPAHLSPLLFPSKSLLRRSRFASYMKSVGQVYTTPDAQLRANDWGVKYETLATPVGARPDHKARLVNMTLPEVDSVLGLPVFKPAEKSARFVRMWGGEATAMRMKPEAGQANWATDKGRVADPWAAQGERIVVSREYLHRQQLERAEAWRLRHRPTDAEAECQARQAFVRDAGLPDAAAAQALFAELWTKWLAFVHAEEGDAVTLARWISSHGSAADFALELNNLRYEAEAKASFFDPDSLANNPTEEDWETIVAHAQKRRLSLSDWEAVIRDLHEVGTPEDQAFDRFLRERAAAQLPKTADAAAVAELVDTLREDGPTGEAFLAFASELKEGGSSLAQWAAGPNTAAAAAPANPYTVDAFLLNPNEHDLSPDLAPAVERMTDSQFARYLESIKTLQPKYRQHLLGKLAANLEKAGGAAAALPVDTTLAGLSKAESLVPVKESKEFIRRHFADAVHEDGVFPARHPTGGLQHSLATKLEVASARPLQGYHLGKVQLGAKDRTQDLHSIGGLVVAGSPSNALGGAGLQPLDLGLTTSGQWRSEERNADDGKYFFKVDRAVLADPPKVVGGDQQQRQPLEYGSVSRGPDFEFQTAYPLSVDVSRADFPPDSAAHRVRTSPLDAYGRGERFLGGREWVGGAHAKQAGDVQKLRTYQTPSDIVRGLGRR